MLEWMVRGMCGPWTPALKLWYIAANLGIAAAYFILPLTLLRGRVAGIQIGTKKQTILWAAFIFFCGAGHLLENVGAFWVPNYYVFAGWHSITAIISIYTALSFPRVVHTIAIELRGLREWKLQE